MNFVIQSTFKLKYLQYATIAYSILIFSTTILLDNGYGGSMFEFLKNIPHYDKIGHFMVYGFWTFLLNYSLNFHKMSFGIFRIFTGSFIAIFILSIEEYSQSYSFYRDCSYYDLLANYLGILIFGIISEKLRNYIKTKILTK
ncbi:MAG: hypothetical protein A2033_02220 [Bacteroidetes bacterium GWA2_31_9]|nr:MAG: hypothetical protein A2033_02220 [Bacteroidetes bacterium GWA2_31_9]